MKRLTGTATAARHAGDLAAEHAIRRVLKGAPQDLWLETIRRARYASHNSLISWMLQQPECDFAVAVHAFYRSNPAQHLDKPLPLPPQPDTDEIFARVLLLWDMGYFRHHELCIEEQDAPLRQIARLNQKVLARPREVLPFQIPQRFLQPTGGRPMQLASHLSPSEAHDLWVKYAQAGLDVPPVAPGISRKIVGLTQSITGRLRR